MHTEGRNIPIDPIESMLGEFFGITFDACPLVGLSSDDEGPPTAC